MGKNKDAQRCASGIAFIDNLRKIMDEQQQADELLRLLHEAGYFAEEFLPGETLEEFMARMERQKQNG